jgi:hypothetical protein
MFFETDAAWQAMGDALVAEMAEAGHEAGLAPESMALVLVAPGPGGKGALGFAHRGDWPAYPCSLVKSFHLVHALMALEAGRVQAHSELDRALRDMILWSSNTATNYVIDVVTGTTGDTLLYGADYMDWCAKRERLNFVFEDLGWPEWAGSNITQKLMDDRRYGRESQFAGVKGENLNRLTPLAAARLLWALFEGELPLSRPARGRAQAILSRDPAGRDAARVEYQLSEYLGGDLPPGVLVWSKAGHNLWTGDPAASWFKHDMIRLSAPGRRPLTAVLMSQGQGVAEGAPALFPRLGRLIWDRTKELTDD